jgi:predicted ABC-type ATPase
LRTGELRREASAAVVIAGPNGAGKTTVTTRLREERWSDGVEYLNPDDVARDRFGDWNSPEAVLSAAQWTEARREELLAASAGFAFETASTPRASPAA